MLLNILNVLYLLVAIGMVAFILLQRGPGATAGSGFGAGASATVFGARGSANFLSRSTAVLALLFFALSLGMAMYVSRSGDVVQTVSDLGVMGEVPASTPANADESPSMSADEVPSIEVPAADGSVPAATEVPAGDVPAADVPAAEIPASEAPAGAAEATGSNGEATESTESSPQEDASGQ
jgi:preprotein translocase subunit SecG